LLFDWRAKLKRKINLTKRTKNNTKIKIMLQFRSEIKKNNNFYKRTKRKIRNQNNKD